MLAVGNLSGLRGALCGSLGISLGAVAGNDVDAGMSTQPSGDTLRSAIRQEVNNLTALMIDQDGAVCTALAKGEIIDAYDTGCTGVRVGCLAYQT